jgi:multidrug resistance efflux pump
MSRAKTIARDMLQALSDADTGIATLREQLAARDAEIEQLQLREQALAASLGELLNYIEHFSANRGKATTAEQWQANVARFRETVSSVGIGRTAVDEATADLAAARALLDGEPGYDDSEATEQRQHYGGRF